MDFVKRNLFWFAVGALVVAGGAVFAVWGVSARKANDEQAASIKSEANEIAQNAGKPQLYNEQWAEQQSRKAEALDEQLQDVKSMFQQTDAYIEKRFADPMNPSLTIADDNPGIWKTAYNAKVAELSEMVNGNFETVTGSPFMRQEYGNAFPSPEEVARTTKRFWVQYYLIHTLVRLNQRGTQPIVPVFGGMRLEQQPERLLLNAHEDTFKTIPFEMELMSDFQSVPLILSSLRNAEEISCYITSISLDRATAPQSRSTRSRYQGVSGPPSGMGAGPAGDPSLGFDMSIGGGPPGTMSRAGRSARSARSRLGVQADEEEVPARPLVRMVVKGYVADYEPQEEEPAGPPGTPN